MVRKLLLATATLLGLVSHAYGAPLIIREFDLPAINLTYIDLSEFIGKIRELETNLNKDFPERKITEELRIRSGDTTQAFLTGFELSEIATLSDPAFSFEYTYHVSGAPLAYIVLEFTDYSQKVRISGTSSMQVETLGNLIEKGLEEHSKWLGGPGARFLMGFSFFILAAVFLRPTASIDSVMWKAVLLLMLLAFARVFSFWDGYFPGFAVYPDSAVWWRRNLDEISFFGTAFSIITFFVSREKAAVWFKSKG
jgi:hypothetical protein